MRSNLRKISRISSSVKIAVVFVVLGMLSLAFSIINNSSILAFIGLGLTFWGALFFLVRPVTYVKGTLLDASAASLYATVDRIIRDFNYKGKGFYIPPYPKEVYLPEHLKGLKEMIVYISAGTTDKMPSIEEIAESKFIIENPEGITISPPGAGLLTQFERELRIDLTKIDLGSLCESLPQLIIENFQLAKEIDLKTENGRVQLTMVDSMYKRLYREEDQKSVYLLGCPIASAIACAIAKTTGKIVTIQSVKVSPDTESITILYNLIKG
ncbi:MAG: hypothetical protein ACUVT5_05875 [Candidatus Bathyarchaeales archaeon]